MFFPNYLSHLYLGWLLLFVYTTNCSSFATPVSFRKDAEVFFTENSSFFVKLPAKPEMILAFHGTKPGRITRRKLQRLFEKMHSSTFVAISMTLFVRSMWASLSSILPNWGDMLAHHCRFTCVGPQCWFAKHGGLINASDTVTGSGDIRAGASGGTGWWRSQFFGV